MLIALSRSMVHCCHHACCGLFVLCRVRTLELLNFVFFFFLLRFLFLFLLLLLLLMLLLLVVVSAGNDVVSVTVASFLLLPLT